MKAGQWKFCGTPQEEEHVGGLGKGRALVQRAKNCSIYLRKYLHVSSIIMYSENSKSPHF